jgi:predicted SprT family Zn-dependent metalloprotease
MAIYEYKCDCRPDVIVQRLVSTDKRDEQFCPKCGFQLQLVPSVPAWVPSGKYGKGKA